MNSSDSTDMHSREGDRALNSFECAAAIESTLMSNSTRLCRYACMCYFLVAAIGQFSKR